MNVELRHQPAFAVARVNLDPNETLQTESGAMMAHSAGVSLQASTQGGVMKGLKRAVLGGESLFVSTYTAPPQGGWVDVVYLHTGDIVVAGILPDQPMFVTRGSWLANSGGVTLDTKWGGFKNLFGGEGGFLIHASGQGTILLGVYGAIDTISLAEGEAVTIDTGHVVAYGATVQYQLRKAAGGAIQSMKSGEGLVFDFVGPGWVMTQTRNPAALEAWIKALAPAAGAGGAAGAIGGLLSR